MDDKTKPHKGNRVVNIDPRVHHALKIAAAYEDCDMAAIVERALLALPEIKKHLQAPKLAASA